MDQIEATRKQVDRLRIRAHRSARAQYMAARVNSTRRIRLGVPALVLSTLVGTSVFGSLMAKPATSLVIATGIASVSAAVLSALQTFFSFDENALKHRTSAAEYAGVKRNLDLLLLELDTSPRDTATTIENLTAIVNQFNSIEKEAPSVPDAFYDNARKEQDLDIEGI